MDFLRKQIYGIYKSLEHIWISIYAWGNVFFYRLRDRINIFLFPDPSEEMSAFQLLFYHVHLWVRDKRRRWFDAIGHYQLYLEIMPFYLYLDRLHGSVDFEGMEERAKWFAKIQTRERFVEHRKKYDYRLRKRSINSIYLAVSMSMKIAAQGKEIPKPFDKKTHDPEVLTAFTRLYDWYLHVARHKAQKLKQSSFLVDRDFRNLSRGIQDFFLASLYEAYNVREFWADFHALMPCRSMLFELMRLEQSEPLDFPTYRAFQYGEDVGDYGRMIDTIEQAVNRDKVDGASWRVDRREKDGTPPTPLEQRAMIAGYLAAPWQGFPCPAHNPLSYDPLERAQEVFPLLCGEGPNHDLFVRRMNRVSIALDQFARSIQKIMERNGQRYSEKEIRAVILVLMFYGVFLADVLAFVKMWQISAGPDLLDLFLMLDNPPDGTTKEEIERLKNMFIPQKNATAELFDRLCVNADLGAFFLRDVLDQEKVEDVPIFPEIFDRAEISKAWMMIGLGMLPLSGNMYGMNKEELDVVGRDVLPPTWLGGAREKIANLFTFEQNIPANLEYLLGVCFHSVEHFRLFEEDGVDVEDPNEIKDRGLIFKVQNWDFIFTYGDLGLQIWKALDRFLFEDRESEDWFIPSQTAVLRKKVASLVEERKKQAEGTSSELPENSV